MSLQLHDADPLGPEALALLREAAVEARALYPERFAPDAPWPHNVPTPPGGAFLLARLDGEAAGCAALHPLPADGGESAAEVRRLFVRATQRRRGVAAALLGEIERRARAAGTARLRLQTGDRQDAAMRLYEALGFARIPPFGAHRDDPGSVCYEKRLAEGSVRFRRARAEDLEAIVALLADDPLGARRERFAVPLPAPYRLAFQEIDADAQQELIVACAGEAVVGVLQLSVIPGLTHLATRRGLIEGVRVARDQRSRGLGRRLFEHAIARARERGCAMVQLTTDKARPEALRFYRSLGFVASHEGMKLRLAEAP